MTPSAPPLAGLTVHNASGDRVCRIAARLLVDAGAAAVASPAGARIVLAAPPASPASPAPQSPEPDSPGPESVVGSVTAYGSSGPLASSAADPESLVTARYGLASAQAGWQPGPSHLRVP